MSERRLIWILSLLVVLVTAIYAAVTIAKQQRDMRLDIERRGQALARGIAAIESVSILDNLFLLQRALVAKHRIEDVVGIAALDLDHMVVASDNPDLIGTMVTNESIVKALEAETEVTLNEDTIGGTGTVVVLEPLFHEPDNRTGRPDGTGTLNVNRELIGWIKVDLSMSGVQREALQLLVKELSFVGVLMLAALFLIRSTVRRLRQDLDSSDLHLRLAQRIAKIGNWEWNPVTNVFSSSSELCRLIGVRLQDGPTTFQEFLEIVVPEDRGSVKECLQNMLEDQDPCNLDHRIRLPNGADCAVHLQAEVVRDEGRRSYTVIGTTQDISDRKRSEREIHQLAYYDALTGLPNRVLFKDRLAQATAHAKRYGTMLATMFLDLDRFKVINDTLGHTIGDVLLKAVADRLAECVRHSDSVGRCGDSEASNQIARLGGDEFTVLLTNLRNEQDAALVARRILHELAKPFLLDGREMFVTASIGISIFPSDGTAIEALLKNADTAMYHAKEQGRNNYQFYSATMNALASERLALENQLRKAVERHEVVVYYQPQVNLLTNRIVGAEALVRWNHPQQGILGPAVFLPVAAETGLIREIDEEVLAIACREIKSWEKRGCAPIRLSVNVSNSFFHGASLISAVTKVLQDADLKPECLEVELTESIAMHNVESSVAMLRELSALGVQLSIDDFGTGYSSLSYLRQFPLDQLKIDQSFVGDISSNPANASITRAIIALAHSLNLTVLAEGVEQESQLALLREQGCDEVQGYLFGHPMSGKEFFQLLVRDRDKAA